MKLLLVKATTSKLAHIFVPDSSSTTGAGLTGLAFNSASLVGYYYREGAGSATAITLATSTLGTFTSGAFKEISSTNMPGVYEIGIPDAALATGCNSVTVMYKGATNMAPVVLEIQLTDINVHDAVRGGMTAMPNVAAAANGGLPTVDASNAVKVQSGTGSNQIDLSSGLVKVQQGTSAGQLDTSSGQVKVQSGTGSGQISLSSGTVTVGTNNDKTSYTLTAAERILVRALVSGTASSGSTTTLTDAALTQADTNYWNDHWLFMTSGNLSGQGRLITGFNAATDTLTVAPAFTQAVATQTYEIRPAATVRLGEVTHTNAVVPSVTTVTGNVNGAVGSVTGAVGSVTGAVGSVTGAVGSVTGNVGGNVVGSVASVTGAVGSVTGNVGGNVTGSIGSLATQAKADVNAEADTAASDYGALKPTVAARTLDVSAAGEAGVDWANVGSPTTTLALTGTSIASVSGAVGSVTGAVGSVTGSVGSVTGAVGSVTGAVGSVTGAVGGNVTGSVGSLATQAKADVKLQMTDALAVDTYAEPTTVVAATATIKDMLNWIKILCRNKITQTATVQTLKADDGTTSVATASVADDTTTFSKGEWS